MSINSVKNDSIAQDSVVNAQKPIAPTITGYTISGKDDTALDPAGGQTILLNGTGFQRGATITIDGSAVSVVSWVSTNQLSFTSTAKSAGTYAIYVVNADLGTAIYIPGLIYSALPTWTTSAGSLGSYYETQAISNTVVASGDAPITYSLYSGSLPTGASLSSGGVITGTSPADSGSTTYTFTVQASDAQLQDSTRSFSLTINTDVVTWSAPANASVTTSYEYVNISNVSLSANNAANTGVTFSANALPTGLTLSGNVISGASTTVGNTAVLLTATGNTTTRNATRTVYFNTQQDSVTWVTPTANASISLDGTVYSQALSATSAAGFGVSYTANSLPTGLTLSAGTISGTPTVEGSTATLLTATAATTSRSATNTITWTVSLSDTYWKYATLLLTANSSIQTQSFVSDNSLNNSQLTVYGDTRAQSFNPYQLGYYSVSFNGSTDYIKLPNSQTGFQMGSSDFTIEFWMYPTASTSPGRIINNWSSSTTASASWEVLQAGGGVQFNCSTAGTTNAVSLNGGITVNAWNHIAGVRIGNVFTLYCNGVSAGTATQAITLQTADTFTIGARNNSGTYAEFYAGYISNIRIIKGTGVYTTGFTPSTTPLLLTSATTVLTANTNKFSDSSINNYTLTLVSSPKISSAHPFTTVYQAGTQYYSNYFDGSGDYLTLADNAAFDFSTGDVTVEAWIYLTGDAAIDGDGLRKASILTSLNGSGDTTNGWGFTINGSSSTTGTGLTFTSVITSGKTVNAPYTFSKNTWYHVAYVRSSGTNYLYVNGTALTLDTNLLTSGLTVGTDYTLYLGSNANASYRWYFPGNISNFRIVKGSAVYTSSFTPSTTPLTAVSGTSLLTCQNNTFKDNSINAFTITAAGDVKPVAVSPFTPSSYTSTQITTYGSGYFDGTGDYIKTLSTPGLNFGTSDFTIECWVWLDSSAGANASFFTTCPAATYNGVIMGRDIIGLYSAGGSTLNSVGVTLSTFTWIHIAMTRSGTSLRVFLNGVQTGSTMTNSSDINSTLGTIGSRYVEATGYLWLGYISDLRVIKGTALYTSNFVPQFTSPLSNVTNTQLLTLQSNGAHNNSTSKDSSSFNNVITRNGNTTNGTFSPYGDNYSVYFNGTTDYLQIASTSTLLFGTNDFTVEAWVYHIGAAPNGGVTTDRMIFGRFGTVPNQAFFLTNSSLKPAFWDGTNQRTSSSLVTPNTWTHVSVTRSSNNIYFSVNGTVDAESTSAINFTTASVFNIGSNDAASDRYFPGYISNLRVTIGTGLYTSNFTVSTSPLPTNTKTALLTCQSNRFIDNSVNNFSLTRGGSTSVQKFSPFSTVTVPKYYSTYFNGTTDYLTITYNSSFQFGTNDFTIESWLNFSSVGNNPIVGNLSSSGLGNGWELLYNNSVPAFKLFYNSVSSATAITFNTFTPTVGVWYHVAVVRSSNNVTLYINGVSYGTFALSANITWASGDMYIGSFNNNLVGWMPGYMSNLRVVNGTAVYTSAFTPPTTPLTAVANTKVLTCQSNTFIDNSTNNFTITAATTTAKPLQVSPFTPTASTPTSYSTSTFGGSMYFDGTGDYLTSNNTSGFFNTTTDNWTVQGWYYWPTTRATSICPLLTGTNSGGTSKFGVWFGDNDYFYVSDVTTTNIVALNTPIPIGQWTHVAVVNNAGTVKVYMNGVVIASVSNGLSSTNITQLVVGSLLTYSWYVNAWFTDVSLTKAALYTSNFYPGASPATPTTTIGTTTYSSTLLLNGTSGGALDATRTVNLETVADAKVTPFSPYNTTYYSNYFDGTGDYLQNPANASLQLTGDFTLEAWVYITTLNSYNMICGSSLTTGNPDYLSIISPNYLQLSINNTYPTWSFTWSTGVWYHVAISRSGSTLYAFVNGTALSLSSGSATNNNQLFQSSYGVQIGRWGSTSTPYYFTGYISNFRIVKGTALYTSAFTPSTTPLTAIANTSLLTCQSNKFVDNSTNAFTITINGDVAVKTQNPFQVNTGQSYYFDGTGDAIGGQTGPNSAFGTGDFTLETWFYLTSAGDYYPALMQSYDGTYGPIIRFGNNGFGNKLQVMVNPSSTVYVWSCSLTQTQALNQWYHVALVRQSGTCKLFLNGVLQSIGSGANPSTYPSTSFSSTESISSTAGPYIGQSFTGYLTDCRISRYARYTTTFTPPTTPYKTN